MVFADSISGRTVTPRYDKLVTQLKILSLLELFSKKDPRLDVSMTLAVWLQRTVLVLPKVPPPPPRLRQDKPKPSREPAPSTGPSRKTIDAARSELLRFASQPRLLDIPAATAGRPNPRQERQPEAGRGGTGERHLPNTPYTGQRLTAARPLLSSAAARRLTSDTREVMQSIGLDAQKVEPFEALAALDAALLGARPTEEAASGSTRMLQLGGITLNTTQIKHAFGAMPSMATMLSSTGCSYQAGVGDLLVVRQKLKAYEASDFAHVENVLAGEFREREHRRLNLREEITTNETEKETTKERDLQSTERNEMQSESEKTVQSEFGMEAGLQLSGSYGPTVSFSSSLNVGFSTSSEESERNATSFSKEVTEKTAERIRERTRDQLQRRVLEQIEELNRHKIDNSDASNGHVRGIYRWLSKVYDAQVFNYGQRMMFEFVIPEPAAYFLYAIVENAPNEVELEKPSAPRTGNGRPLHPSYLTADNAQDYIAAYEVLDAPTAPSSVVFVSHFDQLEDSNQMPHPHFGRGTKVAIPSGYETSLARISGMNGGSNIEGFHIVVGGKWHIPIMDGAVEWITFDSSHTGEIGVSVYVAGVTAYVLGLDFYCTLSADGLRKWQQNTYDAIMRAYQAKKAAYEEKLAALAIQKGIQILGRNPAENRRLEREELKKSSIMILTDDVDPSENGFATSGGDPVMDIDEACAAGSRIRFFENAFEWKNMTYVFYPYFWGRKAKWISALHMTDPDPDFAGFLKAGAARVQVPVRPGFESAISYYCQTGLIWNGNDAPLLDDDLYVPIVEEITDNLGKLDDGVPYPADSQPWEVRIPTELVLLQDLSEVSGIKDAMTQTDLTLLPVNP
jgi:hypothetical protein